MIRTMRVAFILILIVLQQCQGKTQNIDNSNIHSYEIIEYIKDSLPGYRLVTDSIIDCSQMNKEETYCCTSDFNGDGFNDIAILLRDTTNRVCLFSLSLRTNVFKHYLLDCFGIWDGEISDLSVAIEPKGKWEAIDETINVPFDGIIVNDLRKSLSKAYYWNGEKFVQFLYD